MPSSSTSASGPMTSEKLAERREQRAAERQQTTPVNETKPSEAKAAEAQREKTAEEIHGPKDQVPKLPEGIQPDKDHTFSPDKSGWHFYRTENQVATKEQKVTPDQMREQVQRSAVPGQDPNKLTQNGEKSTAHDPRWERDGMADIMTKGPVRTDISKDGLSVRNTTLPGHPLHPGAVLKTATQNPDGSWKMTTTGYGNNDPKNSGSLANKTADVAASAHPATRAGKAIADATGASNYIAARINENEGRKIFNHVDKTMAENIRRQYGE